MDSEPLLRTKGWLKNHPGFHRLEFDIKDFSQQFVGKRAMFYEGRFLGWEEEVNRVSLSETFCLTVRVESATYEEKERIAFYRIKYHRYISRF